MNFPIHNAPVAPIESNPWDHPPEARLNVATWLAARASERPDQRSVVLPGAYDSLGRRLYSHLTTVQLNALCDAYAHGLTARGVKRGDRVLMLVSQSFELIALTYALFKMGAVPVMIDPGMGRKPFLACIEQSTPSAMIGIPRGHLARKLFGSSFKSIERAFITQKKFWAGAHALADVADFGKGAFACVDTHSEDLAAILFTSGSTGIPKGVHYTHGIFDGQVRAIGSMYGIEPGEIEVPAFPLFSLFSIALGMTCILPDMDPTKPAEVNPAHIVEAILDHGATTAFGSPAVWRRVGPYCIEHGIKLPSLKRILTAGAPIHPSMMLHYKEILSPGVALHTPYGATENLPVSTISSTEVLGETYEQTKQGMGLCVGMPIEGMKVEIIAIDDAVIAQWGEARQLACGEIGEICVSGSVTTRSYDRQEAQTRLSKIQDPGRGEGGYLDERGRLWYCGRKKHRVETPDGPMFSILCESIFNAHEAILRSALVGMGEPGQQVPVILYEIEPGHQEPSQETLRGLAKSSARTSVITHFVHYPNSFPVDRRHNAKIHREELAAWLAGQQRQLT
jgi:acyl-coenzyme A synthetase/AMP-(fatty) acid ligase